jgi:chorismate mutase
MDGLMIEVHSNPSEALSDSAQQLNFDQFRSLMTTLIIRKPTIDDKGFLNQLEELRNQIDSIDFKLIELVASRMNIRKRWGNTNLKIM